ncbi:MAG: NAD-dependent epimerase/dehydratase family protein [Polyangiaceae bacterium]|jgi:UDP-glucose 4-epimerase|nr:NAD-dependent epimerase/dehydratase family protein [Polyangiaceae bacterium]
MKTEASVPSRRGAEQGGEPTILVTGLCGRLGRRVVRRLHRDFRIVGIDRRPFPDRPRDVKLLQFDLRRKKTKDVFRAENVQAVVHLGVLHNLRDSAEMHHEWNVVGFQKLLEYAAAFRVPKVVVLSSANVYGPRPDNPQFLAEENPLLGGASFSEIRDLIEVDMLAQSFFWRHPETETVILRPVHILGSVRNAASNYLRLRTTPTVMGFDPMVQVVHEDDVVQAIERALIPGLRGIFNVAGPPPLPLSHLLRMLKRTRVPVPYPLLRSTLDRMFRLHLSSFPSPELDHIRYVCMVDDSRAREQLGYAPLRGIEETVFSVEEGRWW